MHTINVAGEKFGLLTVRKVLAGAKVACDCDCGTQHFVTESYSVRKGLTKSCGCLRLDMLRSGAVRRTHGESVRKKWTPEYRAWVNMITRCHNPNATGFKNWGGRGIEVCAEWRNNFPSFLNHIGRRPSASHSVDRFPDHNGNYEPGNVRWATNRQQSLNTRRSRFITAFGKTLTLREWSDATSIRYGKILNRLARGWETERALTA